jgi:hypothetical protein
LRKNEAKQNTETAKEEEKKQTNKSFKMLLHAIKEPQ